MTYEQACVTAILANPRSKVHTAWDFGDFFLFSLAPIDYPDNQSYESGTIFIAVDKHTGRVFDYDITSDFDAFENAKVIKR